MPSDPLRDAEAAAREDVWRMKRVEAPHTFTPVLDAYRDAIEKRVRAERGAEVRALVEAAQAEDVCFICQHEQRWHVPRCSLCEFGCSEYSPKQALHSAIRALSERSDG